MPNFALARADARNIPLDDGTVQTIVTSPPYWALRDYGYAGGIGLEATLGDWLDQMVYTAREWRRVLRDDGTLWVNMGDAYAGSGSGPATSNLDEPAGEANAGYRSARYQNQTQPVTAGGGGSHPEIKVKDLIGQPWRLAMALQADGWHLRSDIIWAKPNPMPESATDRPTKAHEYVFLLTKAPHYFYDGEAVREAGEGKGGRNRRSVWFIPTQSYKGAHFATFPEKLVEPCILAGTSPKACGVCGAPWERVVETSYTEGGGGGPSGKVGTAAGMKQTMPKRMTRHDATLGWRPTCDHDDDTGKCLVLDPFCGSGTTGAVAVRLGRRFFGTDLSPEYLAMAETRIARETPPLFVL